MSIHAFGAARRAASTLAPGTRCVRTRGKRLERIPHPGGVQGLSWKRWSGRNWIKWTNDGISKWPL